MLFKELCMIFSCLRWQLIIHLNTAWPQLVYCAATFSGHKNVFFFWSLLHHRTAGTSLKLSGELIKKHERQWRHWHVELARFFSAPVLLCTFHRHHILTQHQNINVHIDLLSVWSGRDVTETGWISILPSFFLSINSMQNEEQFGDSHLSRFKPFGVVLYLAMYITGHVHRTHSSIASSRCVSGTHPQLGGDELSAVQGQPSLRGQCRERLSCWCLSGRSRVVICGGQAVCMCVCVWPSAPPHSIPQPVSLLCFILWARVRSGGIFSVMHEVFTCGEIPAGWLTALITLIISTGT